MFYLYFYCFSGASTILSLHMLPKFPIYILLDGLTSNEKKKDFKRIKISTIVRQIVFDQDRLCATATI